MSKNVLNLWMIGDASESLKAKRLKFRLQLYLRRKEKFTNLAFFAETKNAFTSHDRALIHIRKLNF